MKAQKILKLYRTKERLLKDFNQLSSQLEGVAHINKSEKLIDVGHIRYLFKHTDQLFKYENHHFNRVQVEERVPVEVLAFISSRIVPA